MKSLAMKRHSAPSSPHNRQARPKVRLWDLWIRIRFTRVQLLLFLLGAVLIATALYVAINYSSLQDVWQRRRAVDTIQACRARLLRLEEMPKARSDILNGARSQIEQAEDALNQHMYMRAMSFAQQGIDLLDEELQWLQILETGRAAKFERIDGKVQVRRPGSDDWEAATPEMEIEEESEIRTDKDGTAKIRFDNGASTEITPDSLLIVRRLSVNVLERTYENDMRLEQGEMEYRSQRRTDASQVEVGSGSFRAKGAVRMRAATREKSGRPTAIEVLEGQGQFADLKGNLVAMSPMTRLHVERDGTISVPKPILRSPDPIAPPTASSLRFPSQQHVVVPFRWSPVSGAASYRLEISESSRFDRITRPLEPRENQLEVSGLGAGTYWWRVRSVDDDGTSSEPGAFRSFRIQITDQAARPQGEGPKVEFERVKFLSRNSVLVEGTTTFGVQLIIDEQLISVDLKGHFRDIIVFSGVGNTIHVEAIDPDGNRSSFPVEIHQ